MLARQLKEDQGYFGLLAAGAGRVLSEVTRVVLLPSFANLCYHKALDNMDRGRFQSGDPTPGGSEAVLVSLPVGLALYGSGGLARQRLSPYLFSKSVCPLGTGQRDFYSLFRNFLI
jgi:hypothetical protein